MLVQQKTSMYRITLQMCHQQNSAVHEKKTLEPCFWTVEGLNRVILPTAVKVLTLCHLMGPFSPLMTCHRHQKLQFNISD